MIMIMMMTMSIGTTINCIVGVISKTVRVNRVREHNFVPQFSTNSAVSLYVARFHFASHECEDVSC